MSLKYDPKASRLKQVPAQYIAKLPATEDGIPQALRPSSSSSSSSSLLLSSLELSDTKVYEP